MVDVLIAGGGIAGSALAILLGRRGLTVELFERARFPREKPCGEGLMPAGVAVLQRLGLAEAVGGAPFYGVRYHLGDRTAEGRFPEIAGVPVAGRAQRRKRLDYALFQAAAVTPGVTAHTGTLVEALLSGSTALRERTSYWLDRSRRAASRAASGCGRRRAFADSSSVGAGCSAPP